MVDEKSYLENNDLISSHTFKKSYFQQLNLVYISVELLLSFLIHDHI